MASVLQKAEYKGRQVTLNKPFRTPNGPKKFAVYVKDPKTGNVKIVRFGDPKLEIKRDDPERRKNFRARHGCDNPGPKTKAKYWSCKMWSSKNVSELTKSDDFAAKLARLKQILKQLKVHVPRHLEPVTHGSKEFPIGAVRQYDSHTQRIKLPSGEWVSAASGIKTRPEL